MWIWCTCELRFPVPAVWTTIQLVAVCACVHVHWRAVASTLNHRPARPARPAHQIPSTFYWICYVWPRYFNFIRIPHPDGELVFVSQKISHFLFSISKKKMEKRREKAFDEYRRVVVGRLGIWCWYRCVRVSARVWISYAPAKWKWSNEKKKKKRDIIIFRQNAPCVAGCGWIHFDMKIY